MSDSPIGVFPQFANGIAGPQQNLINISTGTLTKSFTLHIAARTTAAVLDADKKYFSQASAQWSVRFNEVTALNNGRMTATVVVTPPVAPAGQTAVWTPPASPYNPLNTSLMPANMLVNSPWVTWSPGA